MDEKKLPPAARDSIDFDALVNEFFVRFAYCAGDIFAARVINHDCVQSQAQHGGIAHEPSVLLFQLRYAFFEQFNFHGASFGCVVRGERQQHIPFGSTA